MARSTTIETRDPSQSSETSTSTIKPKPPVKLTGIIILPPSYRRVDDEESPTSSTSDSRIMLADPSASAPNLPGVDLADSLDPELTPTLTRRMTSNTSTSTATLNVRFAPLPQLAPRKRRSNTPLGIASRATMMRRRRAGMPGYDMNGDPLPPQPPMWTEEEIERHTQRMLAEQERERSREDAPSLGKMFKGVWRKVNNNGKKPASGASGDAEKPEGAGTRGPALVVAERVVLAPLPADNASANAPEHQQHAQEEEGGVWEEEVGEHFPLNVGQTETIVEGRYPWLAQLALDDNENGSASDDASARTRTLSSSDSTEEDSSRPSSTYIP